MQYPIKTVKKTAAAVLMAAVVCVCAQASASAADARLQVYVPGYGEVDTDALGITDEMIEQYAEQAGNIDTSDPEAADAQIREMAAQAGYDISEGEAENIRQVLQDAQSKGMGAEEIKGMYDAYSGVADTLKETNDFLGAVKGFFVGIINVFKIWLEGLFHLG